MMMIGVPKINAYRKLGTFVSTFTAPATVWPFPRFDEIVIFLRWNKVRAVTAVAMTALIWTIASGRQVINVETFLSRLKL